MNGYTVRYQLGGEEFTVSLEAENAASAARIVEDQHIEEEARFELIEVHLVEESDPDLDVPPLEHVN